MTDIADGALAKALRAIEDRQKVYGTPQENHQRIATLWNAYLGGRFEVHGLLIEPEDVALMQILLKIARLIETPDHADSWTDIAGYAAIGDDIKREEPHD